VAKAPRHATERSHRQRLTGIVGQAAAHLTGRLPDADLEDCLSQATLEMVIQSRRQSLPADERIIAGGLQHKFASRITATATAPTPDAARPPAPTTTPPTSTPSQKLPTAPMTSATTRPPATSYADCSPCLASIHRLIG